MSSRRKAMGLTGSPTHRLRKRSSVSPRSPPKGRFAAVRQRSGRPRVRRERSLRSTACTLGSKPSSRSSRPSPSLLCQFCVTEARHGRGHRNHRIEESVSCCFHVTLLGSIPPPPPKHLSAPCASSDHFVTRPGDLREPSVDGHKRRALTHEHLASHKVSYTLNLKKRMSPSRTTYSLPSDLSRPFSFTACSLP